MRSDARRRTLVHCFALPFGMIVGGVLQNGARMWLPIGAVKEFFTTGLAWSTGPAHTLPILVGAVSAGPIAIDVSLIAVLGILIVDRLAVATFA